jgi:hydroxyacylglutathione hydrolase
LFNAGAGNCHNGGHPEDLFETFARQLEVLGDDTLLYPGHEYLLNNLAFTLDREPDNRAAAELLEKCKNQDPAHALQTTLGQEKEINTFFRLQSPTVIAKLAEKFPEIGDHPNPRTVFLKLRELRNSW